MRVQAVVEELTKECDGLSTGLRSTWGALAAPMTGPRMRHSADVWWALGGRCPVNQCLPCNICAIFQAVHRHGCMCLQQHVRCCGAASSPAGSRSGARPRQLQLQLLLRTKVAQKPWGFRRPVLARRFCPLPWRFQFLSSAPARTAHFIIADHCVVAAVYKGGCTNHWSGCELRLSGAFVQRVLDFIGPTTALEA